MYFLLLIPALVLLYLFLIAPGRCQNPAPFSTTLFCHRGLHTEDGTAPENSLPSFEAAAKAGLGVELDIQLTADDQIVVFHDETLKRMCGADIKVRSLTYQQLCQYTLQGGQQHIPLLKDALATLGNTTLLCEIKCYSGVANMKICQLAAPLLQSYPGPVCIESFDPLIVRWFYKHMPGMVRGLLAYHFKDAGLSRWQSFILKNLLLNFCCRPQFIAHDYHRVGLSLWLCKRLFGAFCPCWTIYNPQQEQASRRFFDTIIFEQYLPTKATKAKN